MASLPAPTSSGRLIEVSGVARDSSVPARLARSAAARPPGPDTASMARPEQGPGQPPPGDPAQRPPVSAGERVGELAQRRPVHLAGDHRDDGRVAGRGLGFGAGQPARPALAGAAVAGLRGHPGPFGGRRARHVPQLGQPQVDLDLGGLPAAGGQRAGGDEPAAGVLQRVVAALRGGPGVLRPAFLPSASSTADSAAAQPGVRSPWARPAR